MTEGPPPPNDGKKPEQNRRNRGAKGRFLPGNQANPLGRPKGSRNRTTRLVEQLLDGEAEALTHVLVKRAKAGDSAALSLVFARLAPPRKERTIEVALPPIDDLIASHDALITAVASGDLTPAEGNALAHLLDQRHKAVERVEFALRLAALEARLSTLKEI